MDTRDSMLRTVDAQIRRYASTTGCSRFDPDVRAAMQRVPREMFVPERYADRAFYNGPLPIGHGQTISQPLMVALMTTLIEPWPGAVVLEVGTGSGYQAAVLAELVRHVYSVEVIESLAHSAVRRLSRLGYHNVDVKVGDGHAGWPEHAPYDGIVVTAVAPEIPKALVAQLRPGGRMVLPIGEDFDEQQLVLVTVEEGGAEEGRVVTQRNVLPVTFVPLVGGRH